MAIISSGAASHKGLKKKENQDTYELKVLDNKKHYPHSLLLVLADGMGGSANGKYASQLTVNTISTTLISSHDKDLSQSLKNGITNANALIFNEGNNNPQVAGMGTTATAIVIKRDLLYYAHVGDSRGYLINKNSILQITTDHNMGADLLKAGVLSKEKVSTHPDANKLTRAVGLKNNIAVETPNSPIPLKSRDYILLCCDGLYQVVPEPKILQTINKYENSQLICDRLVELAIQSGGPDNITVLVAEIDYKKKWTFKWFHH